MKNAIFITSLIAIFLLNLTVSAQTTEFVLEESSSMVVVGTSTLHDWEADVEEFDLRVTLNPELMQGDSPESPVTSLVMEAMVASMESGKGGMNRRMYNALEEDDHPKIIFNLTSAELSDSLQTDESFTLNVTGALNIAGTTNEISFPVTGTLTEENRYQFEGSYTLDMREYNVDPPTAMLGTIKTGEEVTIRFNILLSSTAQS